MLSFLLDSLEPGVRLSTSSPNFTKESNINVVVEFTKPVFGFEASMVKVNGGKITRQVHLVILYYLHNYTDDNDHVVLTKQKCLKHVLLLVKAPQVTSICFIVVHIGLRNSQELFTQ